jgi:hypothetical protein
MTMQIAVRTERTGLRHDPAHASGKNFNAPSLTPLELVAVISGSLPCFG